MTSGSLMQAMIRITPPQAMQLSMSIPKTRFRRCAQVIAARRSAAVGSSGSAPLAANIACVDYSVAKPGGKLVAYQWAREQTLSADQFVWV